MLQGRQYRWIRVRLHKPYFRRWRSRFRSIFALLGSSRGTPCNQFWTIWHYVWASTWAPKLFSRNISYRVQFCKTIKSTNPFRRGAWCATSCYRGRSRLAWSFCCVRATYRFWSAFTNCHISTSPSKSSIRKATNSCSGSIRRHRCSNNCKMISNGNVELPPREKCWESCRIDEKKPETCS